MHRPLVLTVLIGFELIVAVGTPALALASRSSLIAMWPLFCVTSCAALPCYGLARLRRWAWFVTPAYNGVLFFSLISSAALHPSVVWLRALVLVVACIATITAFLFLFHSDLREPFMANGKRGFRHARRFAVSAPGQLRVDGELVPITIEDVSRNGALLFLERATPVAAGTTELHVSATQVFSEPFVTRVDIVRSFSTRSGVAVAVSFLDVVIRSFDRRAKRTVQQKA